MAVDSNAVPAAAVSRGLDDALLPSYVPALVLDRLAARGEALSDAERDQLHGALLFADISGFTALTERLAARGPAGIEQLVRRLNAYFGRLIEVLLDHGGDVLKFAGDALVVLFRDRDGQVSAGSVQRAAAAALTAQVALLDQREDAEGLILSLKIAIACGELSMALVGGERGRWEMVVYGEPLLDAGDAAGHCVAGSVVLSAAARARLGEAAGVTELAEGVCRLDTIAPITMPNRAEPPALNAASARSAWSFVPYAIRSRLTAGQDDWLAESRRLTVIFATLPGHADSVDVERLQSLMRQLQQLIYSVEGSVNKISVDDKGLSLIAVLGMPPLSHEDDPRRGLLLALKMRALISELGFKPSIGVTTGRAFCGVIGSQRRREYTLLGDIVNLSARLMVASAGGLLCDQATHDFAEEHFDFEPRPPLKLKGKAEPVPAWRPLKPSHRRRDPGGELVGREVELARLTLAMDRLSSGSSALWLIEAEPGVGKSKLLTELGFRAGRRGLRRFGGATDSLRRDSAYVLWQDLLTRLLAGNVEDPEPAALGEALLVRLSGRAQLTALAPVLNDVMPIGLPETPQTAALQGEGRAAAVRSVVAGLLSRETPLLLTLDDLQWLDSASWSLLLGVLKDVGPLLVVASSRYGGTRNAPAEWRELIGRPGSGTIRMEGLDRPAVEALLMRRLGVSQVEQALADFIAERSDGNPFHLEQLLLALKERDLLQVGGDRAGVKVGVDLSSGHGIPDTIEGLITQRIDKLDPTAQLTLKVASVVGRAFGEKVVNAIFPVESLRGALTPYFGMLVDDGLTREDRTPAEARYYFGQIATREVAYNLMLYTQRRDLHRAVADWVEANIKGLEPHYADLAQHLLEAGAPARARAYLLKAGDQAMVRHACAEAERLFRQALQLEEGAAGPLTPAERCHVLLQIGQACYWQGRIEDAIVALRQGLALSPAPIPERRPQMLLALAREVATQWWRLRTGLRPGAPRLPREQHQALVDAYRVLAHSHYTRSERLELLHAGLCGLNLAERLGPSAELAEAEATVGVIASVAGSGALAKTYARRVQGQLDTLSDPARRAPVLFALSVHHSINGDWAEAMRLQAEAAELAEAAQNWRLLQNGLYGRARCAMRLGELALSHELFERLEALGRRVDHPQAIVWGLSGLLQSPIAGQAALQPERIAALSGLLDAEARAARGHLSAIDYALGHGALALALLRAEQPAEAEAAARQAGDQALSTDAVATHLMDPLAWAAEVHLDRWSDLGDADGERQRRVLALEKLMARYAGRYPFARPILLRLRAERLRGEGEPDKAQAGLKAALKAAEQRQMHVEAARCLVALAELGSGAERDHALAEARRRFESMGAQAESSRLPET